MIFAAGLGTRLRPLTDRIPKPLVEVAGTTLLERVARSLIDAGADRLIINTHHHADQIERFVADRDGFGVEVRLSHEADELLDTGGGLLNAAAHFRRDSPFFLHNGDVLTDTPLRALYAAHAAGDALATLAVRAPRESRYLLFDDDGLCGVARRRTGEEMLARSPRGQPRRFDFAGIHVVDPLLLDRLTERGAFSIVWSYLRLAAEGARIAARPIDGARWIDVGSFEGLERAAALFASSDASAADTSP